MNAEFRVRHRHKNVLIYAGSDADADMLYGSNFQSPDPFIFIRTSSGKRHLVMSDLEIDRAKAQSHAQKVHSLSRYAARARDTFGDRAGHAEILVLVFRDLRVRSVVVPATFPLQLADELRAHNLRVTPVPAPLFPERIYKRPREVAEIKRVLRATERGMRAAIDVLRSSRIHGHDLVYRGKRLTVETLRAVINTAVLERGCLPAGTIVAPGRQACDPHERGSGPIHAHQPLVIDIFPRSEQSGYFADMTRTVVRGRASEPAKEMFRAVAAAHRLALGMIRHGVRARDVHGAIVALFNDRGFATGVQDGRMQGFIHATGHGLGLELHEPPRIGANDTALEKGMVVTVEPGLYYAAHGGVRIEDTVRVTRTGIENLTRFPKRFEV